MGKKNAFIERALICDEVTIKGKDGNPDADVLRVKIRGIPEHYDLTTADCTATKAFDHLSKFSTFSAFSKKLVEFGLQEFKARQATKEQRHARLAVVQDLEFYARQAVRDSFDVENGNLVQIKAFAQDLKSLIDRAFSDARKRQEKNK